MIVADTSALVTLGVAGIAPLALRTFDVHTTERVRSELQETAAHDDEHARGAGVSLDHADPLTIHHVDVGGVSPTRVDEGEHSCAVLARDQDADFLVTDDLRALPELEPLAETRVAISPIVLRALVERGELECGDALDRMETVAEIRDWLGAPIHRRAPALFDPDG